MVHNSCLQVLVKPLILAEILWLDGSVSASGKAELMFVVKSVLTCKATISSISHKYYPCMALVLTMAGPFCTIMDSDCIHIVHRCSWLKSLLYW